MSKPAIKAPIKDSRITNMHDLVIASVKAQRAIDKKMDNISNSLLLCAKAFQDKVTIDNIDDDNSALFLLACKDEEDFIKSDQAKQNQVDKLPRSWTQAKSNIKAALNYGIDLSKYESESMLRKEVIKRRGSTNNKSDFDKKFDSFKADLKKLPTESANELLDQLMQAAAEAVQSIIGGDDVEIVAKENDLTDEEIYDRDAKALADLLQEGVA